MSEITCIGKSISYSVAAKDYAEAVLRAKAHLDEYNNTIGKAAGEKWTLIMLEEITPGSWQFEISTGELYDFEPHKKD